MNRSDDLQSIYLQQFQCYLLPLIPLRTPTLICQLPQPSQPTCNPVASLEVQIHLGAEGVPQEMEEAHQEEEAHQVVEEVPQEEEMHRQSPNQMESPWEHYQQSLREIS